MGAQTNACFELELSLEEGLADFLEGNYGYFEKNKQEAYPINVPIPLKDKEGRIYAKIEIVDYSVSDNKTKGNYQLEKILTTTNPEYLQEKKLQELLKSIIIDCSI